MDEQVQETALYPIREVSERTGVNPVTLRAWERRYGLIKPRRTPKGHRLYSEQDIELIQKVVALLETGIPISRVRQVLERPVSAPAAPQAGEDWERHGEILAEAALSLNPGRLDAAYREVSGLYPASLLVRQVLRPALERLTRLEGRDPLARHAASLLRCQLWVQAGHHIWQQSLRNQGPRLLYSALPGDGEDPEALFLALLLVEHHYRLVWLPDPAPLRYLGESAAAAKADVIILFAAATPGQPLLNRELPALVVTSEVPVGMAGPAAVRHQAAFAQAGAKPLPLEEEHLLKALEALA